MAQRFSIPDEYTFCGEYRGLIVAVRNGRYSIFEQSNISPDTGARWPETYDTRDQVERSIDFAIKHHQFPQGANA
jgi:3'-phosphoadenosine 5'-phosphosulfate sulfotransferase (PAPS reductase)/FAD synthetase